MAMKPNYRHERQTRERAKDLKKQEKLRRREEAKILCELDSIGRAGHKSLRRQECAPLRSRIPG